MKKTFLMTVILSFLLISCSSNEVSFEGTIVEVLPEEQQILIEASEKGSMYFRISNFTTIKSEGRSLSFESLEVGQYVKGWYDGSVKESDPPQVSAEKVEIITITK